MLPELLRSCTPLPVLLGASTTQASVRWRGVFGGELPVAPGPELVRHPLPFVKPAESCALDRGDVDERVVRAVLRRDDPVVLGGVEPPAAPVGMVILSWWWVNWSRP